jgi:DNA-binding winged helix-turn-helix (wHTH) protein
MPGETRVWFGPFHLDLVDERVWHGQEVCKLTRKAFAVLRSLVEHSGRLVTKEELFSAVWPEVVVGDATLAVCVRELRRVLGDTTKPWHYIETVHGRGYRFIAPVDTARSVRGPGSEVRGQQDFPQPLPLNP